MIWDGTRVIIWGGYDGVFLNTGALYNPATNTWTTMSTAGSPTARFAHTAIWNNAAGAAGRMIIWGGTNVGSFSGELNTGAIFDPFTNAWTSATTTVGAPSARIYHTAVWTGTEMIIFGGLLSGTSLNTGSRYNPSSNTWITTNPSGPYSGIYGHAAVWTGTTMIVTGGAYTYGGITTGYSNSYNPLTNLWTTALGFSQTDSKKSHYSFLAGNMILIWGGENMADISQGIPFDTNTGYRYFLVNTASSATMLINETLYLYQKY
jgi:hypothetical protein